VSKGDSPPSILSRAIVYPVLVSLMEEIEANDRYGNGLQAASKKGVPGLYNTQNKAMGNSTGLRQYYRYGLYSEFPFYADLP
jgi:hypothetical protein